MSAFHALNDQHARIATMRANGRTHQEIAAEVNVCVDTVYRACRRPDVKAAIAEMMNESAVEMRQKVDNFALDALTRFSAKLNDPLTTDEYVLKFGEKLIEVYMDIRNYMGLAAKVAAMEADEPLTARDAQP